MIQKKLMAVMKLCVVVCALAILPANNSFAQKNRFVKSNSRKITYTTFDFNLAPKEDADMYVYKLRSAIGEQNPKTGKMYGFGMCTPQLLTQSVAEIKVLVDMGFDLALKYDVPVFFHCDYMFDITNKNGGGANPKFYEDPLMCEWTDFPGEGTTHGPVPRNWYNWGDWQARPAVPCFEAPRFKLFIAKQLKNGIVDPIVKRLAELKSKNKEYLFAGVSAGWETHVPDYSPPHYGLDPNVPPVYKADPSYVMQPWEMGPTGYAALYWLGWNRDKLDLEIKKRNTTEKILVAQLLHQVTHDYMERCAKIINDSGIDRDKIYTHIVPMDSVRSHTTSYVPSIWTSVNKYSTPGFTLSQGSGAVYDIDKMKEKIAKIDPAQKNFGCIEGYVNHLHGYDKFKGFLNELSTNGATLINVLGWTEVAHSPYAIGFNGEEVKAVKDWIVE